MAKMTDKNGNPIDFEDFCKQAYDEIFKGKPLTGEGGVLTPLIKEICPGFPGGRAGYPPCRGFREGQSE